MTTYTVAFPKGGTTKTTSAAELVHQLAARGRRVLAIDLDEQGTLTYWLGFTPQTEVNGTAAGVVTGCAEILDAVTPAPAFDQRDMVVDMLVGLHDLADIDVTAVPDLVTSLRDVLPEVAEAYEDVVIDVPPTLGGLTLAGLAAADVVIAPVSCDGQTVHQARRFEEIITHRIARRVRKGQRIHAFIPTRFDGRRVLDREVVLELRRAYGEASLVTDPIREAQVVKDSYLAQQPLGMYAPDSNPAQDYARALRRIIEEA